MFLGETDYKTEALIFKMFVARFLDVSEEETNKMKETAVALIITWAIILKQLFSSGSGIIPGDYSTLICYIPRLSLNKTSTVIG